MPVAPDMGGRAAAPVATPQYSSVYWLVVMLSKAVQPDP